MPPKQKQRDDFRVEPLAKAHDRASFSCGSEPLDNYLKRQASQDVAKRVAVCFVLTPDGKTVAGYYTLSQYSVVLVKLPAEMARRLPKYPEVPTTLLGRLAVSDRVQAGRILKFDRSGCPPPEP